MVKERKNMDNSWISFSDIMTGLMVVFMFIAISYIVEIQKEKENRDKVFKEFAETKKQLYYELDSVFQNDFMDWKVELDSTDLSIKFTNPEILFLSGKSDIRPYFTQILDTFLPRYFDILLDEKYKNKIAEVRIEGHTDTVPAPQFDKDPYIGNIKLSQLRSAEVLKYFRNMRYYQNLPNATEQQLQFWLTANGLSYGRTLDEGKHLTAKSGDPINNAFSRRVEFKIITTSETLVEQVLKEISQ